MAYEHTTRQARRNAPTGISRAPAAPSRPGAVTYLTFALSVGFAGAVVLGLVV